MPKSLLVMYVERECQSYIFHMQENKPKESIYDPHYDIDFLLETIEQQSWTLNELYEGSQDKNSWPELQEAIQFYLQDVIQLYINLK